MSAPINSLSRTLALGLAGLLLASTSQATIVNLSDNGSTATVDLDSSAGMSQWTVTGLPAGSENQLNQQWFWYSIDGVNGGQPAPINTISPSSIIAQSANQVQATYANNLVSVTISYTLTGGGIGQADIQEGITLNAVGSPLNFHFYQYSDFNLLNDPTGDQVVMDAGSVTQWKGNTQIQESVHAPDANHYEANYTGVPDSTLNKFSAPLGAGTNYLTLDDNGSAGPGDVTWAYQWDFNGLTTQSIQKDKLLDVTIAPEPSVAALAGLGLAGLLALRRRTQS